jgi:hypothetical protein
MRVPLTTRLRHTAGRYLPFLRTLPPDREAVFRLRPVRNDAIVWESNADGEALLKIPRRDDRVGRFMAAWLRVPEAKAVQLDEVGSFVWGLCGGENTVEDIVRATAKQYKLNRREVEVSVTTYLQMLAERRYIGFYARGGRKA